MHEVAHDRLGAEERLGLAEPFLEAGPVAELPQGGRAGLLRRQSSFDVRLDFEIDVGGDLLVELAIRPPAHPLQELHGVSPSAARGLRMRATALTIASHLLVSAARRARPVRVSL